MQKILVTNQFPDLYRFLAAMAEASHSYNVEAALNGTAEVERSLLIWAPDQNFGLLDSRDKFELVSRYAQKLNLEIVLSAASNPRLRSLAKHFGWKVLWEMPDLDSARSSGEPGPGRREETAEQDDQEQESIAS